MYLKPSSCLVLLLFLTGHCTCQGRGYSRFSPNVEEDSLYSGAEERFSKKIKSYDGPELQRFTSRSSTRNSRVLQKPQVELVEEDLESRLPSRRPPAFTRRTDYEEINRQGRTFNGEPQSSTRSNLSEQTRIRSRNEPEGPSYQPPKRGSLPRGRSRSEEPRFPSRATEPTSPKPRGGLFRSRGREEPTTSTPPVEIIEPVTQEPSTEAPRSLRGRGRVSYEETSKFRSRTEITPRAPFKPRESTTLPEEVTERPKGRLPQSRHRFQTGQTTVTPEVKESSRRKTYSPSNSFRKAPLEIDAEPPATEASERKPPGRSRGASKALKDEKLALKNDEDEVSDDDNYPEVYKQLKKSGRGPKEILALLKERKAEREAQGRKSPLTEPATPSVNQSL